MNFTNRLKYKSEKIEVTYDPKLCIHAAECVKGLPDVFNPSNKPWVDANGAVADEIANVIQRCPTGALKYNRLDTGTEESFPASSSIEVIKNGPLFLRGSINITDSDETKLNGETRVALCRCGQSKIKPFCDNSHKEINFSG